MTNANRPPTTAALLAEARKLDAEATPSPWIVGEGEWGDHSDEPTGFHIRMGDFDKSGDSARVIESYGDGIYPDDTQYAEVQANAAFIARARTLLPQLADALVAMHARLAQLARRHDDRLCDSDLDRGQMCHYCTECTARWGHWTEASHAEGCPARPMEPGT